jgi:hypothetical protein
MRTYSTILAAALLMAGAPTFAEDAYPIKIERPQKAGQCTNIKATYELANSTMITTSGKPDQSQVQTLKANFEYREDVDRTDGKGNATGLTVTIGKAEDDKGKILIDPGKVILVKRSSTESTFSTKDGSVLSNDAKQSLAMVFSPISAFTQDDTFGSATPRKVGETWPVNAQGAAKEASAGGATLEPKDISGNVTIKALEDAPGGKALRIHGSLEATPAKGSAPQGVTLEKGTINITLDGLFPVDSTVPAALYELSSDMQFVLSNNSRRVETKTHAVKRVTASAVGK